MERKKTRSYRLAKMTETQIGQLADSLGMSRANVIQTAVDRLFQQEMQNMNTYSPNARYEHRTTAARPGMLPPGTRIQFADGEPGTVVESYGTKHLIARRAPGGGMREDTIDLTQHSGVKVFAIETVE